MGSGDLTPNISELASLDGSRSLVDVSNLLSDVEVATLDVVDTVNLHKSSVVVGVSSSSVKQQANIAIHDEKSTDTTAPSFAQFHIPLETKEGTLDVKSWLK